MSRTTYAPCVGGKEGQLAVKGEGTLSELERLKAIHGPKAKEDYKRKTRAITLECFNLPTDPKVCPHLKWKKVGKAFQLKSRTCRIKRCPRDDIQGEEG